MSRNEEKSVNGMLESLDRVTTELTRLRESSVRFKERIVEQARKIKERHADSLLEELKNRPGVIIH